MSKDNLAEATDVRRSLVDRIASSPHIKRSARLRNLLLYLTDRVLEGQAGEIHEQEVGHRVFDRPADYDTSTDNIVRVHASMLRKRLEQYFAAEGAGETLILEIPKGNYAPVFTEREIPKTVETPAEQPIRSTTRPMWFMGGLALLFCCSTAYLWLRSPAMKNGFDPERPVVQRLWTQVFQADRSTDIVLDDAAAGLYQELTGRELTLSNYYDRAYLRSLPEMAAAAHFDPHAILGIALRRETSFSATSFIWKLSQMPGLNKRPTVLRFARDYSFRELKANNALLLGNSRTNPWVEPFESKLGVHWAYDAATGSYYPVDAWASGKKYMPAGPGDSHEGYCAISLLPNLSHTGNVMIIGGTGGSAINAGAGFLADEQSVNNLLRALPSTSNQGFPSFEALIKVKGRGGLPRDATIVVCRTPRQ